MNKVGRLLNNQTIKGFELLELLIVMAAVMIFLIVAMPRFKLMQDEYRIAKVKGELKTLQAALESYFRQHHSTFPAKLSELTSSSNQPKVISSIPPDPFSSAGGAYHYVREGRASYIIYSVGPQGNGSASIGAGNTVLEKNGTSCIYVSNLGSDSAP